MTLQLTRWGRGNDVAAIEIDRLNQMFQAAFSGSQVWVPAADVHQTDAQDLVITADLPAMKREDIKVTFENDVLTIEGERKLDPAIARESYHQMERAHGPFRRSFTLPTSVDASRVAASYQDGVLTITLPRREETRPRTIEVRA